MQYLFEFVYDLRYGGFIFEFKVEATDSVSVAFYAEVAVVWAVVGYVEVESVVEPVHGFGGFRLIHASSM